MAAGEASSPPALAAPAAEAAPMYFLSRTYFDAVAWLDKAHGPDTQAYRRAVAAPTAAQP